MAPSIVVKEKDIKDLDEGRMLCITDPKNNELTTVLSKHKVTIAGHILPTDKNRWIKKDTYKWETVVADTLFSLEYLNYKKDKKDLIIKTSSAKSVIKSRLGVRPNDVNYNALKKIIEKNGVTDFGYDVICSILDSGVRGTLKLKGKKYTSNIEVPEGEYSYILGKPFSYSASYKDRRFIANFYALMFNGELTLLRVGWDKTQAGFYNITNSGFFKETYKGREANKIFDLYLPTYGDETSIVGSAYIGEKNSNGYRFFNSKANTTVNIFWLYIPEDSKFIKKLANGLGGGIYNFKEVYKESTKIVKGVKYTYDNKDNSFVLGEIYGHCSNIGNISLKIKNIAGNQYSRLWIADVENPFTISSGFYTTFRQAIQNKGWTSYSQFRKIESLNANMVIEND